MSYQIEKGEYGRPEIVIGGVEKGIAPSPYLGIADIKNLNINSLPGEASVNYNRVSQLPVISGGSMSGTQNSPLPRYVYGSNPKLVVGSCIVPSSSTITGFTANKPYWITKIYSDNGTYQQIGIAAGYGLSEQSTTENSGETATFSTFGLHKFIQGATEYDEANAAYIYYLCDSTGVVWVNNPNVYNVFSPAGNADGVAVVNNVTGFGVSQGVAFIFASDAYGGGVWTNFTKTIGVFNADVTKNQGWYKVWLTKTPPSNTTASHYVLKVPDQNGSLYYCDSQWVGQITGLSPQFSLIKVTSSGTTTQAITEYTQGVIPLAGLPVSVFTAPGVSMPAELNPASTRTQYRILSYNQATAAIQLSLDTQTTVTREVVSGTGNYWTLAYTPVVVSTIQLSAGGNTLLYGTDWLLETDNTNNSGNAKLVTAKSYASGSVVATYNYVSASAISVSAGSFYITTFDPSQILMTSLVLEALALPYDDLTTCLGYFSSGGGITLTIGTLGNNIYFWTPGTSAPFAVLPLPETNIHRLLNVDNIIYIFAGSKGNIYIANGSQLAGAMTIPDYVANPYGTNQNPWFTWGDAIFLRGRVFLSIQDQHAGNTTGNCGGIWSFTPVQNLFLGQDQGIQLHIEHQNSYQTYNGICDVLLAPINQNANGAQYWSGWSDSYTGAHYGIDFSNTVPYSGTLPQSSANTVQVGQIDTDIIPIGTYLTKGTPLNIEYKISRPMVSGDGVEILYRPNLSASFKSLGTDMTVGGLAFPFPTDFENLQWVQFRVLTTTNGATTSSFVPFKELRIRL